MRVEHRPPYRWLRRVGAIADRPSWPRDRRTLAYHEAGHAVLSELCGMPVDAAEINAKSTKGEVRFVRAQGRANPLEVPKETLEECAMEFKAALDKCPVEIKAGLEKSAVEMAAMYVGGVMCELLLHDKDVAPGAYLLLNDGDWDNARHLLWMVFACHTPLFYCQRLARAVLSENWAWVEAVAAEIESTGVADGATIRRLQGETLEGIPALKAEQPVSISAAVAAGAEGGGYGHWQPLWERFPFNKVKLRPAWAGFDTPNIGTAHVR